MRFRILDLFAVFAIRLAVVATSPLLVFTARTWRGRLLGFAVVSLLMIGVNLEILSRAFVAAMTGSPAYSRLAIDVLSIVGIAGFCFSSFCAVVSILVLLFTPPAFTSNPVRGVSSHFLGPTWLHRWQMILPPEDDAIWLGAWLISRLDPWMNRAEAQLLRDGVREFLDEMQDFPEYQQLAPALGLTIWGRTFRPDHGHFFTYIPDHEPSERLGVLIALHGHGGNARMWLHVWRRFADTHRFVIVCPSFGYGNWEHPESHNTVDQCLNFVGNHYPVNLNRVFLAGISQGGAGVSRAAAAFPDRFAGLIYLSPTMEPNVLNSPGFVEGGKGRPVFVAQGGRDHNVKPSNVTTAVKLMQDHGANVTYHLDPDADHFLFFAQLDAIQQRIAEWIASPQEPVVS